SFCFLLSSICIYYLVFSYVLFLFFFFFTAPSTTEIYTLSLHDALPILRPGFSAIDRLVDAVAETVRLPGRRRIRTRSGSDRVNRSEEHTSELQSLAYLVCRLLLEKKKKKKKKII